MNNIRLALLVGGLVFSLSTLYGQQEEIYPKNEIELNSFKFGFNKNFEYVQGGLGVTYRRMISKHLALHSTANGNIISYENNDRQQNYLSGYLGLGATWFLKENRQGLYISSTFQNRFLYDFTSKSTATSSFALSTAVGARVNLTKSLYLNGSMELNYDFDRKSMDLAPNVGVGFRF